ncbi:hypothetical protein SDC9_172220 [bioreactor metagenome]|uniref:Uncharacterized protein n=1 Tax=bioreactor metagenome TaxID=1076179 RepID=A0A645GF88_9ZZZZ
MPYVQGRITAPATGLASRSIPRIIVRIPRIAIPNPFPLIAHTSLITPYIILQIPSITTKSARTTKGLKGYANTISPIRIPMVPESSFHPIFSLSTSSDRMEITPPRSQKIPSTCINVMVVDTGVNIRNMPIRIVIIPSSTTSHQGIRTISCSISRISGTVFSIS